MVVWYGDGDTNSDKSNWAATLRIIKKKVDLPATVIGAIRYCVLNQGIVPI